MPAGMSGEGPRKLTIMAKGEGTSHGEKEKEREEEPGSFKQPALT